VSRGFGVAAGLDPEVARPLADRCAELGYDSVWSNDHPGAKGLETLAEFAAAAPEVELGVAVIALDRTPPQEIAADIERLGLEGAKLWLGVGAGFSEKPLTRMREALPELREALPGIRLVLAAMGPKMCALAGAKEESFYRDLHAGYRNHFDRLAEPEGTVGVAAADSDTAKKKLAAYTALDTVVVRGLASAKIDAMAPVAEAAAP